MARSKTPSKANQALVARFVRTHYAQSESFRAHGQDELADAMYYTHTPAVHVLIESLEPTSDNMVWPEVEAAHARRQYLQNLAEGISKSHWDAEMGVGA